MKTTLIYMMVTFEPVLTKLRPGTGQHELFFATPRREIATSADMPCDGGREMLQRDVALGMAVLVAASLEIVRIHEEHPAPHRVRADSSSPRANRVRPPR
ncbi:hypothetical protein GGD71_006086 [Variovorax guangxiensis]|uniref:Uncharacterized protein n=1 Tax=Variovorax guangxiensis TaxID=1775474 RepID=A0A840FRP7_9BURK|nr:hypothetical protein [Variovorax guangxiensis]